MKYLICLFIILTLISGLIEDSENENCSVVTPPSTLFANPNFPLRYNETFTVIELNASTGAKCLDGTNVKFNFSKGEGSGKNKFFIFFLGGGLCGSEGSSFLASCLARSSIYLGSSKFLGPNGSLINVDYPIGYFSNSPYYNPKFANWNKIGINYCDGSLHQGYLKDPVLVNGTELWFRGYNNTIETIEYARKHYGLFEAEEIIISGESSGGQAVLFSANYFRSYFPKKIKLIGIVDAGFFVDFNNINAHCHLFRFMIKNLINLTNSGEIELFRKCKFHGTKDFWKCLIPQYIAVDIKIPIFLMNSQADFEILVTHYGIICLANGSITCSNRETIYHGI